MAYRLSLLPFFVLIAVFFTFFRSSLLIALPPFPTTTTIFHRETTPSPPSSSPQSSPRRRTKALQHPQSPPPPPPPLPTMPPPSSSRPAGDQQLANIVDALIGSGDFGNWADLFKATSGDHSLLPISATLFVPDDVTLPTSNRSSNNNNGLNNPDSYLNINPGIKFDPFVVPYHIVPERLTFADLQRCAALTRLPTLLPGQTLLITNNSAANFTIDSSRLTHPDIYTNAVVVVHGVSVVFDYARFGNPDEPKTNPGSTTSSTVPEEDPARTSSFDSPGVIADPASGGWSWELTSGGGRRSKLDLSRLAFMIMINSIVDFELLRFFDLALNVCFCGL